MAVEEAFAAPDAVSWFLPGSRHNVGGGPWAREIASRLADLADMRSADMDAAGVDMRRDQRRLRTSTDALRVAQPSAWASVVAHMVAIPSIGQAPSTATN
jgi:hypothetical protein